MTRRLATDEAALWAKVVASVTPLHPLRHLPEIGQPVELAASKTVPRAGVGPSRLAAPTAPAKAAPAIAPTETLDRSWDRRISSGRLEPDVTIDLHGMTLDAARATLYRRVAQADAMGHRILLVITGKGRMPGPAPADLMPGLGGGDRRGAIRVSLPRWLGEQGLSSRIAAVRRAHPKHGGEGAAYLVLKRKRSG